MNYGRVENPVWSIFIYGDVQLKHERMSLKKENWTSKQLVAILLDIRKNHGVSSFTILALEVSLKLEMHISLSILNFMGEIKLETDFQEEHDDTGNTESNLILSWVQADVSCPSASYSQIAYPQEAAPLKESTVQEKTHISNNLSIYLQEHEVDLEIKENDPIDLQQALQSFNAHKWIDAMNEIHAWQWPLGSCLVTWRIETYWL